MQQRFNTRNYSVRDFEEWYEKGELVLAPKFQRRKVWIDKARSYLIDTIIRGKPIPKIYMRQETNPTTRRTIREIVDGQQRLHTVLTYVKDAFKVSKTHNEECGGRYFSQLAWIYHDCVEQRSGESVRRLDITQPNENATRRFFCDRL